MQITQAAQTANKLLVQVAKSKVMVKLSLSMTSTVANLTLHNLKAYYLVNKTTNLISITLSRWVRFIVSQGAIKCIQFQGSVLY